MARGILLETLKKRADFLSAADSGKKWVTPGFVLQIGKTGTTLEGQALCRYGLTVSKKIGNAVARNRAHRRLRAIAREVLPINCEPGYDYVIIARQEALTRDYADLRRDLEKAAKKLGAWRLK